MTEKQKNQSNEDIHGKLDYIKQTVDNVKLAVCGNEKIGFKGLVIEHQDTKQRVRKIEIAGLVLIVFVLSDLATSDVVVKILKSFF